MLRRAKKHTYIHIQEPKKNQKNNNYALTFSWSMWRRSLISRRVLFASILLSKAFAIFFTATCSVVSEFTAELTQKKIKKITKYNKFYVYRRSIQHNRGFLLPDDAVSAFSDWHDWGFVFGGNLEYVAEDVVLDEAPAVAERRRYLICLRRRRRRLLLRLRLRHLVVGRLIPVHHFWDWMSVTKTKKEKRFHSEKGKQENVCIYIYICADKKIKKKKNNIFEFIIF